MSRCSIPRTRARWLHPQEDELVVVKEGQMLFTVTLDDREETIELAPGDELFIAAGIRHSTKNTGEGEALWYYGYG